MTRCIVYGLTVALSAVASPSAQDTPPPSQLVLEGVGTMPLAADARRTHLLGAVQTYTVAVYVNGSLNQEHLAAADVAKVLRIDVDLHR